VSRLQFFYIYPLTSVPFLTLNCIKINEPVEYILLPLAYKYKYDTTVYFSHAVKKLTGSQLSLLHEMKQKI